MKRETSNVKRRAKRGSYTNGQATARSSRTSSWGTSLEQEGWTVVRIWETDARADLEGVADLIEALVGRGFSLER